MKKMFLIDNGAKIFYNSAEKTEEVKTMALSNLYGWKNGANSNGTACGSGDKGSACGSGDKGSACGSGDKGTACGSGDK